MTNIAKDLLKINAVILNTQQLFTWASGIQSLIYCDNRITISYPQVRQNIVNGFIKLINTHYAEADVIVGTATAGIPHAAFISQQLERPMAYVRTSSKAHGRKSQIEGYIAKGSKVLIVEDLISTGGSSIKVAEILRQHGYEVLGVIAIFSYQLSVAQQTFEQHQLPHHTLTNFDELINIATEMAMIDESDRVFLTQWHNNLK